MRTAIYAGSFDPITRGHEDLIMRSLAFVDRLIVAVARNVNKTPLFSHDERVALPWPMSGASRFTASRACWWTLPGRLTPGC
jgi:cytidyltransferase-like protein